MVDGLFKRGNEQSNLGSVLDVGLNDDKLSTGGHMSNDDSSLYLILDFNSYIYICIVIMSV